MLALTDNYSIKSEYPVQGIEYLLTYECPNHSIVDLVISSWIKFSLTLSFGLQWQGQTVVIIPILSVKLQNINNKFPQQWEHNVLIYCVFYAEVNIILLHWNKQHLESGIIKRRCRLFNEHFHLVLMFTCFGSMQIWIGLKVESSGLHLAQD